MRKCGWAVFPMMLLLSVSLTGCGGRQEAAGPADPEPVETPAAAEEDPEIPAEEERIEETEEPEEEDRPLDLDACEKLKGAMDGLIYIGDGFSVYDETRADAVYAGEEEAVSAYFSHIISVLPEADLGEYDDDYYGKLYSADQVRDIMQSLTGAPYELHTEKESIPVEILGDGAYLENRNWKIEYTGKDTWEVHTEAYRVPGIGVKAADAVFTVTENPESIFDGYSITKAEISRKDNSEWAKAYYDYLSSQYPDASNTYCSLIYLDDDDVPELYTELYSTSTLFSCVQGEVKETAFGLRTYGYSRYVEHSGLIWWNFYDMQEENYDRILKLSDGELQETGLGHYWVKEEYDGGDDWQDVIAERVMNDGGSELYGSLDEMYHAQWNEEDLTFEEYDRRLYESYDKEEWTGCLQEGNLMVIGPDEYSERSGPLLYDELSMLMK